MITYTLHATAIESTTTTIQALAYTVQARDVGRVSSIIIVILSPTRGVHGSGKPHGNGNSIYFTRVKIPKIIVMHWISRLN